MNSEIYVKFVDPNTGNIIYKIATIDEIVTFYHQKYPELAIEILKKTPNVLAHVGYILPKKSECKMCYFSDGCSKLGKINAHCMDYFPKTRTITFPKGDKNAAG